MRPLGNRQLGGGGLQTPPLILGGNVFGWTADEATSFRILDAFVERGGVMIDTADVYSAWVPGHEGGESEGVIGRWLKASGNRDRVLIATKKASLPAPASEPAVPEQASKPEVKAPDPAPVAHEEDAPLSDDADLEALRTEATTLGIEVDRRWKQARLAT